jgi:hypothetical protein
MKKVSLKKYLEMREVLVKEKADLEQRLAEVNRALGATPAVVAAPAAVKAPAAAAKAPKAPKAAVAGKRRTWKRASNEMSLKDAVLKVTAKGALTKQQILDEVQKLGYKFSTSNPLNRLGVLIYGKNPKFKNDNGKFSPA